MGIKAKDGRMNTSTILLIEDNDIAIKVSTHMLRQQGFGVDVEKCGIAALSRIQTQFYPLILLDLGLPDMDGYQIARKIREIPAYASSQIIALTAHSPQDTKIREACKTAGIDDVWGKPLNSLSCMMLKSFTSAEQESPFMSSQS